MIIQIVTIIAVLYLLVRTAAKYRKREITLKESIGWGILWFAVGIVVLYPRLTDRVAAEIGLKTATGIDLVVYVAVGVVFYLVFRLFVRIERIERDMTKIVRHVALKDDKRHET